MASVKLSPVFNDQAITASGAPASGYALYTYVAGSSTAQATYTDSSGATPQSNPIVLNALGYPANPIWLAVGQSYKFVLKDTNGVTVGNPIDNISGVNDASISTSQWQSSGLTPTFVSTTSFTLVGDQTTDFHVGRRLQFTTTAGTVYGTIKTTAYTTLTTVTLTMDGAQVLDSGLSVVNPSILRYDHTAVPPLSSYLLLIASQTASNSSSIDFAGLSGSDDDYILCIRNAVPATNNSSFILRFSQAGSFITALSYNYIETVINAGATTGGASGAAQSLIVISDGISATAAEGGLDGDVQLFSLSNTTNSKKCTFATGGWRDTVGMSFTTGSGLLRTTPAVDGVRISTSSGNIVSGTFLLYKRRKS